MTMMITASTTTIDEWARYLLSVSLCLLLSPFAWIFLVSCSWPDGTLPLFLLFFVPNPWILLVKNLHVNAYCIKCFRLPHNAFQLKLTSTWFSTSDVLLYWLSLRLELRTFLALCFQTQQCQHSLFYVHWTHPYICPAASTSLICFRVLSGPPFQSISSKHSPCYSVNLYDLCAFSVCIFIELFSMDSPYLYFVFCVFCIFSLEFSDNLFMSSVSPSVECTIIQCTCICL